LVKIDTMKKRFCLVLCLLAGLLPLSAQQEIPQIADLDLEALAPQSRHQFWLEMVDDGMGRPICVPVMIIKGKSTHPVLGLVAAIHGNELNGIPVIQQIAAEVDPSQLEGSILAIPGLNAVSLELHQRTYVDETDLNRIFPGKKNGNRAQQYVWAISQKILPQMDYLIDLHTASFGRENCLYVRGDLEDEKIAALASWQEADVLLHSSGGASVNTSASSRTMRAQAMLQGVPTITVELGNPQVYQEAMIRRGVSNIWNTLKGLAMIPGTAEQQEALRCKNSFWIYLDRGGYLEVPVQVAQRITKGAVIGILRNPFGEVIKTYYAPQDGVVIGRSSNPINRSGGRIIHLGLIDEDHD
jgi:hypothetical protein